MIGRRRPSPARGEAPRDEGSAMIMVLILVAVASLIVLPMLDYATAIGRQNTVLSTKTKRQEAVKAGLRTVLADPSKLFEYCAEGSPSLAGPGIDGIDVETTCNFIDFSLAELDEDLHLGLVATRVGETIPNSLEAINQTDVNGDPLLDGAGNPLRFIYTPQTTDVAEWLDPAAPHAPSSVSAPRRIWLPNLPVHSVNLRGASGFPMPDGYPECRVFFPGTYRDPIVLDGPTYFASGVYYFQDSVTVAAGADVTVGMGRHLGCTTDQEAVFYATNAPAVHTISGLGATFLFGRDAVRDTDGRLIVTNEAGSTRLRFNQRYVAGEDAGGQPSFGVSIASVNGKALSGPDASGEFQLGALDVPGVNQVPASVVGVEGPVDPEDPEGPMKVLPSAGEYKLQPSGLTHEPRRPSAPRWDEAQPLVALRTGGSGTDGAVRVRWQEPERLGGLPVDDYVVTSTPGDRSCVPVGLPLECVVTGLSSGTAYTFTVTAQNVIGTSDASEVSAPVTPRTSGGSISLLAGPPAPPSAPTVVRHLDDTVVVSWTAPADNNVPITSYEVVADPALDPLTHECVMLTEVSCMIRGLPILDPDDPLDLLDLFSDYTFQVTATNDLGTSTPSPPSQLLPIVNTITPALGASPADPPVVPPAPVVPYEPDPIIDIDLPSTDPVVIDIPGYVAVPQGVVRVNNPHGLGTTPESPVSLTGGIIAAAFRVIDDRAVEGELTVPIGLVNPVVQRTFRITSTTTSGNPKVTSTAIVQINQNGAYAINSWVVQ
jgi:hypothetical protein